MTVRISTDWSFHGFRAVILENAALRIVLLPELGAKIWSIVDKRADREVLWHHPRVPPRPVAYGAAYDDWFCGGWDELFPNDAPTSVAGDAYPDHGEWWSMPFAWRVDGDAHRAEVVVWRAGVVTATRVERRIVLEADATQLRIAMTLWNDGPAPLDFLWKLHPALAIHADSRIDLPARTVLTDPGFRDRLAVERFQWPFASDHRGAPVDLRQVPPSSAATCDFYYAVELNAGWCALTDTRARAGFALAFDPAVFRSVWVFGAYGGWRGLYTTILEPCTGYPYRLEDAIAGGTASRLAPGTALSTEICAVVYHGLTAVQHVDAGGGVR